MYFFSFTMNLRFGIAAPVFEKVIFRGYIWYKLKDKQYNDVSIIHITGLLFGLFHLAGYYESSYSTSFFSNAPPISKILLNKVLVNSGYGILLGYFRYKSKHLYLPFIIHAIGNIWSA
jgi:membrane protease YdiL (CAAX protease family)